MKYKKHDFLIHMHTYTKHSGKGYGIGFGLFNFKPANRVESEFAVNVWSQPDSFFDTENSPGGCLSINTKYYFTERFSCFLSVSAKTKGWMLGNLYLENNLSVQSGFHYHIGR